MPKLPAYCGVWKWLLDNEYGEGSLQKYVLKSMPKWPETKMHNCVHQVILNDFKNAKEFQRIIWISNKYCIYSPIYTRFVTLTFIFN